MKDVYGDGHSPETTFLTFRHLTGIVSPFFRRRFFPYVLLRRLGSVVVGSSLVVWGRKVCVVYVVGLELLG